MSAGDPSLMASSSASMSHSTSTTPSPRWLCRSWSAWPGPRVPQVRARRVRSFVRALRAAHPLRLTRRDLGGAHRPAGERDLRRRDPSRWRGPVPDHWVVGVERRLVHDKHALHVPTEQRRVERVVPGRRECGPIRSHASAPCGARRRRDVPRRRCRRGARRRPHAGDGEIRPSGARAAARGSRPPGYPRNRSNVARVSVQDGFPATHRARSLRDQQRLQILLRRELPELLEGGYQLARRARRAVDQPQGPVVGHNLGGELGDGDAAVGRTAVIVHVGACALQSIDDGIEIDGAENSNWSVSNIHELHARATRGGNRSIRANTGPGAILAGLGARVAPAADPRQDQPRFVLAPASTSRAASTPSRTASCGRSSSRSPSRVIAAHPCS